MNTTTRFVSSEKYHTKRYTHTNDTPTIPAANQMFRKWMLPDENNVERIYGVTVQYVKRLAECKTVVVYVTNVSDWLRQMFSNKPAFIQKRTTEFKLASAALTWEYGIINEIYISDQSTNNNASRETQIHLAGQLIKKLGFSERNIFLAVREGSGANHFTDSCDLFITEVQEKVETILRETAPLMSSPINKDLSDGLYQN